MLRRVAIRLWLAILLLLSLLILYWNIGIHGLAGPDSTRNRTEVAAQLGYLKGRMHTGAPARMQRMFPEGEAFSYALYGLAWCQLAEQDGSFSTEAIEEARWSLAQLESAPVKGRFPLLLPPDHGAFHAGWGTLLLGHITLLDPSDTLGRLRFRERCDTIAALFRSCTHPFPPSYNGLAWPADATVAMAALGLYDARVASRYADVRERWSRLVKDRFDARHMIPHAWDPEADTCITTARGSSMALMTVLLPEIDSALAVHQYTRFENWFFSIRMGVPAVAEFPQGSKGRGDVDSGPLIFGIGPAATIVGEAASRRNGDPFHVLTFGSTIDAFGFALGNQERRYVFGALPIADLFIAWGRSMQLAPDRHPRPAPRFLWFHAWSVASLVLLWGLFLFVRRRVHTPDA